MIDWSKSEKLPPEKRYFNISVIWIFYFRQVIKLFYHLRIPHEIVTVLSIIFGLAAAWFFYDGALIVAVLLLHFKDVFDAADGALARLTGRGHLIGRYLDSLGDFLALTAVMGAVAVAGWHQGEPVYLFWGILAIFSTFIQCSFFNYYQLAYTEVYGIETLSSKRDERRRDDLETAAYGTAGRVLLGILRGLYMAVYGWQDRLVARVDNYLAATSGTELTATERFGKRVLMVMQSALCFGTHIFVIIVFAVLGRPTHALIFIATLMNIYLLVLLYLRSSYYKSITARPAAETDPGGRIIGDKG